MAGITKISSNGCDRSRYCSSAEADGSMLKSAQQNAAAAIAEENLPIDTPPVVILAARLTPSTSHRCGHQTADQGLALTMSWLLTSLTPSEVRAICRARSACA
jgi:hypothetical protein